jgi:hypothetical protein
MTGGSEHHDGSRGQLRPFPGSFDKREAIDIWHVHIGQDKCETLSGLLSR